MRRSQRLADGLGGSSSFLSSSAAAPDAAAGRTAAASRRELAVRRVGDIVGGACLDCVVLGESSLFAAGLGLFAAVAIPAGKEIGCYGGVVVPDEAEGDYVMEVPRARTAGGPYAIDAFNAATGEVHWAGRVNHAPHHEANAVWRYKREADVVVLVTRCAVAAGAELFVDYGSDFRLLFEARTFAKMLAS